MKQFKIDENLPEEVAHLLKRENYDVHTVHDEDLKGGDDEKIITHCISENRTLITLDLDFADIRRYPPQSSPGIVVLRTIRQDKNYTLTLIDSLLKPFKKEPVAKRLWIVEDEKIRIRE